MGTLTSYPALTVGQKQTIAVDFGDYLAASSGESLKGPPTVTAAVAGDSDVFDANAAAIVLNTPELGTVPQPGGTGDTNTAVIVQLLGQVAGVLYELTVTCLTSSGDVAVEVIHVFCQPTT